jgi:hypothetical protein
MSASAPRPPDPAGASALALPPFGVVSNGLPARSWVPLADLPAATAHRLLAALAGSGIAACLRPRRLFPRRAAAAGTSSVWVDVVGYAVAEDLLRAVLADSGRVGSGVP